MMRLEIDDTGVNVWSGDRLAGRYRTADPFKPHLHPLTTPAGHTLSLRSPHDHPHHKGLMYALRTPEVNFWEERPTLPGETPGRQRHDRFAALREAGDAVGFTEELTWLPAAGGAPVFAEVRSLSCRTLADGGGFEWTWETELVAAGAVELTMSQWSAPTANGSLVNYHGLGLRFRRDFGCTGGNALLLDGAERPFAAGMGATPAAVEFRGSIDGTWPIARAGVRVRQDQRNGLFVLDTPFAFLGLGPSNLAPRRLSAGERIAERYVVSVFDLPPP
jgi:hypothetical protein